jgi:hypothetical protein
MVRCLHSWKKEKIFVSFDPAKEITTRTNGCAAHDGKYTRSTPWRSPTALKHRRAPSCLRLPSPRKKSVGAVASNILDDGHTRALNSVGDRRAPAPGPPICSSSAASHHPQPEVCNFELHSVEASVGRYLSWSAADTPWYIRALLVRLSMRGCPLGRSSERRRPALTPRSSLRPSLSVHHIWAIAAT